MSKHPYCTATEYERKFCTHRCLNCGKAKINQKDGSSCEAARETIREVIPSHYAPFIPASQRDGTLFN